MIKRRARELVGELVGSILSPVVASISSARHARTFHATGRTFVARVDAIAAVGPLAVVGRQLEGFALARFSGALWSGFEHLDVLGVALRFRRANVSEAATLPGDQDLLFATVRSPFALPFAPFTTEASDFLENKYWAVSPFEVENVGNVKFRLSPASPRSPSGLSREAALESLVASNVVRMNIEARKTFRSRWTTVAVLTLEHAAIVDQEALRFSPFNCGRGIRPRGLVHAIRRSVYDASQHARPRSGDVGAMPIVAGPSNQPRKSREPTPASRLN